ncbi:MAG: hypothetical protein E6772_06965 [Dysgonomonas sp.]|nr:hypothetical protein [Dysgonomonas sp.]
MQEPKIDIVLPWVDNSDEEWLTFFRRYSPSANGDNSLIRFREWGLLRYWFRSIEKFMPWVNTVHFVTAGHIPEWLNLQHPKLNWVKHSDFIPEKYLPTFNVNTIELNLHRIAGLSEKFIYFNDDIFVLKPLSPTRFFQKGLPCDYGVMTAKPSGGGIVHMVINDLDIINSHFDKHTQIKKHWGKWFNFKYGKGFINNTLLYPWDDFSGFIDPHLTNSFLKSTFEKVWKQNFSILDNTCLSKFRNNSNVNQWLIRYWQLAEGNFIPYNTVRNSLNIDITDNSTPHICQYISNQEYEMICINDSTEITDFEKTKALLTESFEEILSTPSSFER